MFTLATTYSGCFDVCVLSEQFPSKCVHQEPFLLVYLYSSTRFSSILPLPLSITPKLFSSTQEQFVPKTFMALIAHWNRIHRIRRETLKPMATATDPDAKSGERDVSIGELWPITQKKH